MGSKSFRGDKVELNFKYLYGGFPKLGVPLLGGPRLRLIVFWGLYWGPLFGENYHMGMNMNTNMDKEV